MNNRNRIEKKYIYLSSGKGPAECEWVVSKLIESIRIYCKGNKVSFDIINDVKGYYENTYKSVEILVEGIEIELLMEPWIGTIKWIGKSQYRPNHKRMNWFVRVDLIDFVDPLSIHEKDLEYTTYKASGPGGQHRNKVESAIKIVHKPTGIESISSDSRSQHQNRTIARRRLVDKFRMLSNTSLLELSNAKNQMNNLLVRGNPIKIFKGHKFREQ